MTERSGIGASVGFGDESSYGTPVTPTIHHHLIDESMSVGIEPIESGGIIAGARVRRSSQWRPGTYATAGDVGLELPLVDAGLLLKHMMGGTGTTGPFTPADLAGNGLTVQIGKPDVDTGTVRPYTYSGCKVESWEIGYSEGEHVTLGLSLAGRHEILYRTVTDGVTTSSDATITSATAVFDESDVGKPISGTGIPAGATILSVTSATEAELSANATASGTGVTFTLGLALTAVSYNANIGYYDYYDTSVLLAGSSFKVRNGTISGNNSLKTDRAFAGQRFMDEALGNDLRVYGGTLNTEYWSDTAYRRFVTGTEAALVHTFARGTRSITITSNVRFDGSTPNVGGRDIIEQELPYTCIGTTTDASAISIALDES